MTSATGGEPVFGAALKRRAHTAQPAQQLDVRRNLSALIDAGHRMPTATDLAVSQLASHGATKLSVAKAARAQATNTREEAPPSTDETRGAFESGDHRTAQGSAVSAGAPCAPSARVDVAGDSGPFVQRESIHQNRPDRTAVPDRPAPFAASSRSGNRAPISTSAQPAPVASAAPPTTAARPSAQSAVGQSPSSPPSSGRPVGPTGATRATPDAARASAAQRTPSRSPDADQLMAQFGRGLASALKQNGGTVTLRLQPADLGDLKVRVQMQGGRVEARFEAATEKAREVLDQNLASLRTALETRGLHVDRLDVRAVPHPQHQTPADLEPDGSGPGFANDQSHHAGGETGGHGRNEGAGSAQGGLARDLAPDAAAEPVEEFQPDRSGIAPDRAVGGAPTTQVGLDALA